MTTSEIARGWEARQAINKGVRGRIAAIGGLRWTSNASAGFPGFDAPSGGPYGTGGAYYDDSKFLLGKLIEWCCGKTTGATCLMQTYDAYTAAFGTHFRTALIELGHTYQLSGGIHDWNYDPLDYDVLISHEDLNGSETWWGQTTPEDKLSYLLQHDGHILTALNDGNDFDFQPYGLNAAFLHNATEQAPMVNSVFHPTGTILAVMRSSNNINEAFDPPSEGGTTGFIPCDTHPTGCGDPNGCYVGGWWTK